MDEVESEELSDFNEMEICVQRQDVIDLLSEDSETLNLPPPLERPSPEP